MTRCETAKRKGEEWGKLLVKRQKRASTNKKFAASASQHNTLLGSLHHRPAASGYSNMPGYCPLPPPHPQDSSPAIGQAPTSEILRTITEPYTGSDLFPPHEDSKIRLLPVLDIQQDALQANVALNTESPDTSFHLTDNDGYDLAENCLSALVQHHMDRAKSASLSRGDNSVLEIENVEKEKSPHGAVFLSGPEIAMRFAQAAAKCLSENQMQQLLYFLRTPTARDSNSTKLLEKSLKERLDVFYAAEIAESKQDPDRLTKPSGPVNAELGIILHCQTKDGIAGSFWDTESRTIQALAKKGFSDRFTFCYDWHWRAEDSLYHRGSCSASKWTTSLQRLHHDLSAELLSMLHFRFLIVGGACARKHYKKVPSEMRHTLKVPLISGLELELDMEFTGQSLRRIVAYTDHPSAVYFTNTAGHLSMSLRLETGANLFLWLLGCHYDPLAIQTLFWDRGFRRPRSAPVTEMWRYLRAENSAHSAGSELQLDDYDDSFLYWAKSFLGDEYATVVERGDSVAVACGAKWQKGAQSGRVRNFYQRQKDERVETEMDQPSSSGPEDPVQAVMRYPTYEEHYAQRNRELNHSRFGNVIREYWDGQHIKAETNGTVRLFIASNRGALILRATKAAAKSIRDNGNQGTIHFAQDQVSLAVDGKSVYQRSATSLRKGKDGEAWSIQIMKEMMKKECR